MCDPLTATVAAISVAGAVGYSAYQGNKMEKQAEKSRAIAQDNAQKAETQADQQFNRLNQKQPNVSATIGQKANAAKSGVGSTMLTGPAGISNDILNLSQNNLLGV